MGTTIEVQKTREEDGRYVFQATVHGKERTDHEVTLDKQDYERLGERTSSPEEFVRECLRILVDREPQDKLMSRMDVRQMISLYPSFEEEARRRFGRPGTT